MGQQKGKRYGFRKGKPWRGVNGIIAGDQEMERAREGVAIVLNDVWRER